MKLRKHGAVLLSGFVVAAPLLLTVYVVWKALWALDVLLRSLLRPVWVGALQRLSAALHWEGPLPGLGIVVGVAVIYVVGLLAGTWLLDKLVGLAEQIVDKIPLVKSLYSAVRDLLQFLGGTRAESRGKPAIVKSADGKVVMLGLITQENPRKFLPEDEDRIAVYLPMSYQMGGYTVYLPPGAVQEVADMSVEDLMKLTLTAGVGAALPAQPTAGPPDAAPGEPKGASDGFEGD
jgi:uncharacterized membrane protein